MTNLNKLKEHIDAAHKIVEMIEVKVSTMAWDCQQQIRMHMRNALEEVDAWAILPRKGEQGEYLPPLKCPHCGILDTVGCCIGGLFS